ASAAPAADSPAGPAVSAVPDRDVSHARFSVFRQAASPALTRYPESGCMDCRVNRLRSAVREAIRPDFLAPAPARNFALAHSAWKNSGGHARKGEPVAAGAAMRCL